MKKRFALGLIVLLLAVGTIFAASSTLTTGDVESLQYMVQEEKLARDVYLALYEIHNIAIFKNIAQSEQTHMEAIENLLVMYNIPNPLQSDEIGKYADERFETLYKALVADGGKSFTDALSVGVKIEQMDIKDLQEAISKTNNVDLKRVFNNLMQGSEHHLKAFSSQTSENQFEYGKMSQKGGTQRRVRTGRG